MRRAEVLLVEASGGPRISGGYRYNDAIARELRRRGLGTVTTVTSPAELPHLEASTLVVDSLLLGAPCPRAVLQALQGRGQRMFILGHYFPPESPAGTATEGTEWLRSARTWVQGAEGVILTGHAMHPAWQTAFPAQRFRIVPPAIPHRRRGSPARNRPRRLITLGAITPTKVPLPLLRSILQATEALEFTWHLVGPETSDPDHARAVRELLRRHDPRERVVLRGPIALARTRAALARADACLAMSQFESFGMATAEALAVGLPVLAFDVGDTRRWLPPADRETLVPAGDYATYANRTRTLLEGATLPAAPRTLHFPHIRWRRVSEDLIAFLRAP